MEHLHVSPLDFDKMYLYEIFSMNSTLVEKINKKNNKGKQVVESAPL